MVVASGAEDVDKDTLGGTILFPIMAGIDEEPVTEEGPVALSAPVPVCLGEVEWRMAEEEDEEWMTCERYIVFTTS